MENDDRLADVAAYGNYGNLTGANGLGKHRLAALLGCQHYGDDAIERFAALTGEAVDTLRDSGCGACLRYDSGTTNAYLRHVTDGQTMQAALRFSCGDTGAAVVARASISDSDSIRRVSGARSSCTSVAAS